MDTSRERLAQNCRGANIGDLEEMLRKAGFEKIKIAVKDTSRSFIREWLPGKQIEDYLVSATIEAVKPKARTANG